MWIYARSAHPALGGHTVVAVGYGNSKQRFIVGSSWGPEWCM